MQTIAQAITAALPEAVDEAERRRQNVLLERVRQVGPVGADVVNYICAHRTRGDLAALLSVRAWTTLYPDYDLTRQQRRVANLLGIRAEWEEAVR